MYKAFFVVFFFVAYNTLSAQQEATKKVKVPIADSLKLWKLGGEFNLYTSQLGLSNWVAGGQSSVSGTIRINLFANHKKEKTEFENSLGLNYGLIKQNGASFSKSDDKIDLSSRYEHEAYKGWYYSSSVNFKSQFAPGYKLPNDSNKISNFLAPGYIILSFGFNYKPNKKFALLFAPLTGKITLVFDQKLSNSGAFGVERASFDPLGNVISKGKNVRSEFGGAINLTFNDEIAKNVKLKTKLSLFSNYLYKPGNIDVLWNLLITMKVNKYLAASISANLIYDNDIKIAQDTNNDNIVDKIGPVVQFRSIRNWFYF